MARRRSSRRKRHHRMPARNSKGRFVKSGSRRKKRTRSRRSR